MTNHKCYMYYLKDDSSLYAYTLNKIYAKNFKKQRNMKLFIERKIYMDEYEFSSFSYKHKDLQLIHDYLYDGKNDIEIICTVEESDMMTAWIEEMYDTIDTMQIYLQELKVKNKYLKSISRLTDSLIDEKNSLNISTFKLFFNLFKFTFINKEEEPELF